MSPGRSMLTLATAAAFFPVALWEWSRAPVAEHPPGPPPAPAARPASQQQSQASMAAVRAFLEGVRGSNAIQCEMILQSFDAWSYNHAPDRDSAAFAVTTVARRRAVGAQAVPDLVAALRGADDCAARTAARMLGRSRLPAARSELLTALGDASPQVRRLGAIGLGFTSDTTTSPQLVRALADGDAGVRAAAAWALGAVH